MKNTLLNIMQSAGDRDPCKMKGGKHYGIVELLKPCFSSLPGEYKRQLDEWSKTADAATKKTMKPYETAIKTLCDKIIKASTEEIPAVADDKTFEALLDLPMAKEFREALKPKPDHDVESGNLFHCRIILKFFACWEKNNVALGRWGSVKSNLFGTIVYLALQARVQRIDKEVLKKGMMEVNKGELPDRIDYTNGIPDSVCGFTARELAGHVFVGSLVFLVVNMWAAADGERLGSRVRLLQENASQNLSKKNNGALNESLSSIF